MSTFIFTIFSLYHSNCSPRYPRW